MSEIAYNERTGVLLNIGTMDECRYSRKKMLQLKEEGYGGPDFDSMMNDPDTVYKIDEAYKDIYSLVFHIPVNIKHEITYIYKNGYQWRVPCKESNNLVIQVRVDGERFDKGGTRRTLFRCNCCGSLFRLDHLTAMYLRQLYPEYSDVFASPEDGYVRAKNLALLGKYSEISLGEIIEMFATKYDYDDFIALIGKPSTISNDRCTKAILEYNSSIQEFYDKAREILSLVNNVI